ncbi:MAG: M48 family metallopeptidase [Dissulfurispiraceae bacterium]
MDLPVICGQIKGGIELNIYFLVFLLIFLLKEAFEYTVHYVNVIYIRKADHRVPPEFKGMMDASLLEKAQEYSLDKIRFALISSLFGTFMAIIFIFGGLLNLYNSWIVSLHYNFFISGWFFFMLLFCFNKLVSLPFSTYETFIIENKYGFNTTTRRLWIADLIKSFILSIVLLSLLVLIGLWLITLSTNYWWSLVWGTMFAFSIFFTYVSPYIVEPLFNKFTPIEDDLLKKSIIALAAKVGIETSRILRMDASKRSRHANAYFTGVGRTKRVVLYDTLLEGMTHDEIIAILAHEMGHWRKWHLLKIIVSFEVVTFILLYLAFRLTQSDFLLTVFMIRQKSLFAKFVIVALFVDVSSLALKPIMNAFMRCHERAADRFSYEVTGNGESMISALIRLSAKNLSTLYPNPLFAAIYCSHPPVMDRIKYIKKWLADKQVSN